MKVTEPIQYLTSTRVRKLLKISHYLWSRYRDLGLIGAPAGIVDGNQLFELSSFSKIEQRIADYKAKINQTRANVPISK